MIFLGKYVEFGGLTWAISDLHHVLGHFEGLADGHVLLEYRMVKGLGEVDHCFICYFIALLHTDHMSSTCFKKDLSSELRVARGNKHEFNISFR